MIGKTELGHRKLGLDTGSVCFENNTFQFLQSLGVKSSEYPDTFQLISNFLNFLEQNLSANQISKIIPALHLMMHLHLDQRRKNGGLYIDHPIEVVIRVIEFIQKPSPDVIISALLHDTIEDQSEKLLKLKNISLNPNSTPALQAVAQIKRDFGRRVARNVHDLTNPDLAAILNTKGIDPSHIDFSKEIHLQYLGHVVQLIKNPDAFCIKLADFICNAGSLQTLPNTPKKREIAKKYRPLVEVFVHSVGRTDVIRSDSKAPIISTLEGIATYIDTFLVQI